MPGAKKKKLEICSECKQAKKPAINAAKLGHAQCLTTAYRDLGAFNERDDFGATPIHFAARFGKLECLTWLVTRSGVSPNAVSRNGATAAHDAAAMGHVGCLQYLLENTKCSVQDATSEKATVLHMACRFGRLDVVQWLMEFSNSSPGEKGANDVTPVHLCAAKNNLECLQYLTQHPKYVPNEQTVHGATPLYFAAQEGCINSMQWLAEQAGGDLYCTATDGMSPIHAAAQAGQTACLQWLVEKGGVPIRYKAEDGATPAHYAAASGQVNCLDWIIDHGGSIYDRDNLGGTPVHDAAEQGQVSALKYLMGRGMDMAAEDYEGMKPLDLARDNNHEECVQILFKSVKPSILLSLTPHQSLSRGASKADDNEAEERAEKQRMFEEAMLSGVSEERREAIWQSAQQKATTVQPGLKQILDGETIASPSAFSLEGQSLPVAESSLTLTPAGSQRHSRHSSGKRLEKAPLPDDFEPNDLQAYKPRPPLSPALFQQPRDEDGEEPSEPKKIKTDTEEPGSPQALVPPVTQLRTPELDKVTNSPIPERVKFVKKLIQSNKTEHTPALISTEKKATLPSKKAGVTSPQMKKQPPSKQKLPAKGKRPTSPPPKKQVSDHKKLISAPGKRPTSPLPAKSAPGKRPTSPMPAKSAPGKRPTSPPLAKATPGKRPTSPPPAKSAPGKRPTSPPPAKSAPGKRPTSPTPAKSAPGKRPTSPTPAKYAPGKRPTSPPPAKSAPGKRPTSPPPAKSAPGKRPTSPTPKKTKRPTSPPPSKTAPVKKPTSSPSKIPVAPVNEKSRESSIEGSKQSPVKRPTSPPKQVISGAKPAATKRPASVAQPSAAGKPPNVKRQSAPPGALSPSKDQMATAKSRPSSQPEKPRGRPRVTSDHQGKRVVSPTGKKTSKSLVKKAPSGKGPKRTDPSKNARPVKSSKPPSKKTDKKTQSEQSKKDTKIAEVLGNVPAAPAAPDDITTRQANLAIEKLLNESLLQPGTIPLSATTTDSVEGEPSTDDKEEVESKKEVVEQFAEKMADGILEESLVDQVDVPAPHTPSDEVSPANDDVVVLRTKTTEDKPTQPRISSFKEEAVISKPPLRQSLKTEDETVTVSFVTKSSNIKRPFPVTHHQLMTEDDLESPGASDDEGHQRESFTTPGFDRLDVNTFEGFGTDIKKRKTVDDSFDQIAVNMAEEEGGMGDVKKELVLEDETDREKKGVAESKDSFEKVSDSVTEGDAAVTKGLSVKEASGNPTDEGKLEKKDEELDPGGLSRWSNQHSLDKIDQDDKRKKSRSELGTMEPMDVYGPSEVYQKLQDFERQKKDRGYTQVLKMVDRLQGNRKSANSTDESSDNVDTMGSGKINDRLKMFGGGATFIKPPPLPKVPKSRSRSETPSPLESPSASREGSPGRMKSLTRRSSSCLSVTAFETIAEESASGGDSDSSPEKTESTDNVAPLPKIHPGLHRRQSEERLRLDGLKASSPDEDGLSCSKSDTALTPRLVDYSLPSGNRTPSPPGISQRRHSGSAVYSPLMKSSGNSPVARNKVSKRTTARAVSMPPSPPRGSEALALFMNSANLPHLEHLKERHERDQTNLAEKRVSVLLSEPRLTGEEVPLEFRGLDLKEKDKLYAWKQKAGSLNKLSSLDSVSFEPKSIFLFLHTAPHGPLLCHIYLWVGGSVSDFAVQSAYQHCQKLVTCTPGRPVLHREFQGHESPAFTLILKSAGKQLSDKQQPLPTYLNLTLKNSKIYTFRERAYFYEEDSIVENGTLFEVGKPVLLDTKTGVFLWVPDAYWNMKKVVLEISELFIVKNGYPRSTPVTVVTERVETEEFSAHFSSWPWVDLTLGQRSNELGLPSIRAPTVSYPATGQTKAWQLVNHDLQVVPMDKVGQFDSSAVFIVQYAYLKQSPLYTWMEGSVYVWVGRCVEGERETLVKEALEKIETIGPTQLPIVLVPEGKEPTQLLNLYKGKCIIHNHNQASKCRLYKVSGTSVLTMKAAEVAPKASSLHSSHAYILLGSEGEYVWGGQFSSQAERRGAIIIAKTLVKSNSGLIKLAEGLETPEFWEELGGKGKHSHFDPPSSPAYILPHLYLCEVNKSTVLFKELPPTKKEEMKSEQCYFLTYKDQILVWQGASWRKHPPVSNLLHTYVSHYHSRRSVSDFVVVLVTEGKEGEMFWKWFDIQNPSMSSLVEPPPENGNDSSLIVEDIEQTKSFVILDTPDEQTEHQDSSDPIGDSNIPASDSNIPVRDSNDLASESATPTLDSDVLVRYSNVPVRDSSVSRSLALTQSQEVAFEKVEKLRSELEDLVERESEGSGEGSGEGKRGTGEDQTDGTKMGETKEVEMSPVRTSETMKEMSDMINGLDNMLKSTSASALESTEASAVSLQVQSVGNLLETSEDDNLKTPQVVAKKSKKRPVSPTPKAPPSLLVTVEIEGKGHSVDVRVREKAPVITVMFRAAQQAGFTLTTNSALFEVVESLKLYRALEDHELIKDVIALWPKANKPKLLLRDFATKNALWSTNPPVAKRDINAYIQHNTVPSVGSELQHCRKGVARLPWKTDSFTLRPVGIYSMTESKKQGTEVNLSTSLDHMLYIPMVVKGKFYTTPTPFCFVMKPPKSWKEKDLIFYCAPSLPTMSKWIHTIRLFKHGIQLKANFIAMKTRVQRQAQT